MSNELRRMKSIPFEINCVRSYFFAVLPQLAAQIVNHTSCSCILKDTLLHTRKFCSLEASSRQIQSDLPYRAAAETILLCRRVFALFATTASMQQFQRESGRESKTNVYTFGDRGIHRKSNVHTPVVVHKRIAQMMMSERNGGQKNTERKRNQLLRSVGYIGGGGEDSHKKSSQ